MTEPLRPIGSTDVILDSQPVPGAPVIQVDREWWEMVMETGRNEPPLKYECPHSGAWGALGDSCGDGCSWCGGRGHVTIDSLFANLSRMLDDHREELAEVEENLSVVTKAMRAIPDFILDAYLPQEVLSLIWEG